MSLPLLLQHVSHGAVGTPIKSSIVGVPASICHLPPGRGMRGASHDMFLEVLLSVIQAGGCPGSLTQLEKVQDYNLGKRW